MKEKIKRIVKPFLAVIIAGFIVSILYIGLVNQEFKEKAKEPIKLPKISGYDYSDLESRISDLESRIDDLENRTDDVESKADDNEISISDLESQIRRLKWDIDDLESRISDLEWKIRY